MAAFDKTITITFGDVAENHVGNQQIASHTNQITEGFTQEQMEKFAKDFDGQIHVLNSKPDQDYASIIHIPNAIRKMGINPDDLLKEQEAYDWDSQYYDTRRKKVLNKHARHNVCYDNKEQEPDYENKKGRVVPWSNVTLLDKVRKRIIDVIGDDYKSIVAEGNLYYNPQKCGIGFHGDAERYIVIAIRLGETIPLVYQWYRNSAKVGNPIKFMNVKHGDMYIMSAKAVGRDWKTKKNCTLRHAAGCKKYTGITE